MKEQNHNWINSGRLLLAAAGVWLLPQLAAAASLTVSNLNDSGGGSLRSNIVAAAAGDTISFSVSGTIMLTSGELPIVKNLTIIGPAKGLPPVTLDGGHINRVLSVFPNITVNISNLTMRNGYAGFIKGSGVYNDGTLTLQNCDISSNNSLGTSGAGIYNGGTLTLNSCRIHDNSSEVLGGGTDLGAGILNSNTLTVNNCAFYLNSATAGGGIYNGGSLTANNSTFWNNEGGGIYNVGFENIFNCTIISNYTFSTPGGGVYQSDTSGYTLIRNTIIAGNSAFGGGPDVYGRMGFGVNGSQGHNLISKTNDSTYWASTDLMGSIASPREPLLGPLADNGGLTPTMGLLPGSPAIDAGDDAVLVAPFNFTTDQRARPRFSGAHVDIGAYEGGSSPLVTNTNDSGPGSLRNAILIAAPTEVIEFASNVVGNITLTSGELVIGASRIIDGPGTKIVTVSGNNASRVFHITGGASQISNLSIANGHTSGGGGGIAMNDGSLTVNNCAITGCYAQGVDVVSQGGGAIAVVGAANLTIIASTLSSNTTPYAGGGLYLFNAPTVSLINCTVSGNRTLDGDLGDGGGGIFVGNSSTLNLTASTIANNTAAVQGGGVYKGLSGTINVNNSLIAGNSAGGLGPDCKGTFISAGFNLVGNNGGSTGFGSTGDQLNVNPLIGPLQDNGGPTFTHALLAGSPAIDKGGFSGQFADQRGRARPYDFPSSNASGGDGSDIGAFEFNPPVLSIARAANDVVVVSWSAYDTGYLLEAKSTLDPAVSWMVVPGTPPIVDGRYTFTGSPTGSTFFRLRSP